MDRPARIVAEEEQDIKKIDYFWPRTAAQITGIVFVVQTITEMLASRNPEYEWVFLASACAFAASMLWAIACIVWNAWLTRPLV